MRKFALFSHHSQQNAALAELTLLNHWRYSLRWGYDFIVYREPWPQAREWVMDGGELDAMANHKAFIAVGSDVVFTNFSKPIHELSDPSYGLVVTTEHWAEDFKGAKNDLNCGVAIYHNNLKFRWFVNRLIEHKESHLPHFLYHQQVMVDLLNPASEIFEPEAASAIKVIPARAMNSHVHGTAGEEGRWQPGDLIAHCFAMCPDDKMESVKKYLEKVQE